MGDITVICCWNNEKAYNDFVDTLKAQTYQCEIIGIDNRENKGFTSCAAAYNSVIGQVKTKYVVYSHQDILLNEADALEKFAACLDKIGRDDILGVAGAKFSTPGTFTNIMHVWKHSGKLGYAGENRVDGDMEECDTVDECFFGGYAEHFREYPFDEVVCNGWHLYAADACLAAKSIMRGEERRGEEKRGEERRREERRGSVWVSGITLIHLSSGTITPSFHYGFYKLCRKYANTFPFIRTTCDAEKTDFIHLFPSFAHKWSHLMTRIIAGIILRKIGLYEVIKKIIH